MNVVAVDVDADEVVVAGSFGDAVGSSVAIGRSGRRNVGHSDREVLSGSRCSVAGLHCDRVASGVFEVQQAGIGDSDDAG